jgi:hypothetical protein
MRRRENISQHLVWWFAKKTKLPVRPCFGIVVAEVRNITTLPAPAPLQRHHLPHRLIQLKRRHDGQRCRACARASQAAHLEMLGLSFLHGVQARILWIAFSLYFGGSFIAVGHCNQHDSL